MCATAPDGTIVTEMSYDERRNAVALTVMKGAVDMAKVYLQYGTDKELKTLSQNIIESQIKEITWPKNRL